MKDDDPVSPPPSEWSGASTGDSSGAPEHIGPYRILRVLGEGGMGIVYEAEQTLPMTRRVALKVIKLGMDTEQVVARFEAERQALAFMDHPSIARVYDAGATETGRPFFAMERVEGVPITEYCDSRRLSTRQRLELFVGLCQAIQHAHQKGVIHRDLKPSNILVMEQDGKPVPKVIDFGIAKAIDRRLSSHTLVTELGMAIGTPAYMSPEQAEASALDIDTRSDIYSLGVILYELLVGNLPLDPTPIGLPGFIARLLSGEFEPPTPSARLSTMGEQLDTVAKARRTDPSNLRRQLKQDLDWITMKALEHDRNRRYGSASELGNDIERHLRDEPVQARRPSARYRAMKFIRRHRAGVAFAATLVIVLAGSAIGMTVSRNRAVRAESSARTEAAKATAINSFLQRMLATADPWVGGRDPKVVDVLHRAAADIDTAFPSQPEVQAAVRMTLGRAYRGLGVVDEAEKHARAALDIRRRTLPPGHPEIADAQNDLGIALLDKGDFVGAEKLFREALPLRQAAFGDSSLEAAQVIHNIGIANYHQVKNDIADSMYQRSLAIRRRLLGEGAWDVAETKNDLAALRSDQGRYAEADTLFRAAIETRRRLQGSSLDMATIMNNLALNLTFAERFDEAEGMYKEALEMSRKGLGNEHPVVANRLNNIGMFYFRTKRLAQAETLIRQALVMNQKLLGTHHEVASNLNNLSLVLQDQHRLPEAETYVRQAVAMERKVVGPDHPEVASRLKNLGLLLVSQAKYPDAERAFGEALAIQRKRFGDDAWETATTQSQLGECLTKAGRYQDAEPLVLRSLGIIEKQFGPKHGRTKAALRRVVAVYEKLGQQDKLAEYQARLAAKD